MATIGERVRTLRKQRGLSIAAVSALAGVGQNTWLTLERYNIPPKTIETRKRIADALGVSVDELFGTIPENSEK